MKAALTHFSARALTQLGMEAAGLIALGNLASLHGQFGYALAFDRELLSALKQDISLVLSEVGASAFADSSQATCKVSHFTPSDTGLASLVECLLPTNGERPVLVELVLVARGDVGYLTLEQVSSAT